jgi:Arc/MetJ-type ribon-helix-helix transcriptional regulator
MEKGLKFKEKLSFRLTNSTLRKVKFLLKKFPEKYNNESTIIRVAIIKLYREDFKNIKENKKDEKRRTKKLR